MRAGEDVQREQAASARARAAARGAESLTQYGGAVMRPQRTVLLVGVIAALSSTILQLPSIASWRHAYFALGLLLIVTCLAGGYFGAPTGRGPDGVRGGIEAVMMMVVIARAARLLRGEGRGEGLLDLIPYLVFLAAFAAVGGAIGAKMRRRGEGRLPG